jgi:hypothetical protein
LQTGHFANWSFCKLVILQTGHFANRPFCKLVILQTGHFVNQSFCKPVILQTSHFVNWSFCHHFIKVSIQWLELELSVSDNIIWSITLESPIMILEASFTLFMMFLVHASFIAIIK